MAAVAHPGKLVSLADAVDAHLHDGDTVFVGGFGQGVPFAAAREILRQRRQGLTLCRTGADILFDLLIAGGAADGVIFGWYGNPGIGLSHVLRRAVAAGQVRLEETSNFGLLLRLHAAVLGLPFLPARTLTIGDVPNVSQVTRAVDCPFTGERLAAVAALTPDVALIHAQRADRAGNVQMWGVTGDTVEGARAARRVICTVEEVVGEEEVCASPERTVLHASTVASVSLCPGGARPSYMTGHYGRDDDAYRLFDKLSRDEARLLALVDDLRRKADEPSSFAARFGGVSPAGAPA